MASQHARRPLHRWAGPAHRASGLERAVVRNYLRIALALLLALLVLPGSGGSAIAEDAGTTGTDSSLSTEVVGDTTTEPADGPGTEELVEETTGGSSDDGSLTDDLTTADGAGSRMGITTTWPESGEATITVHVGGDRTGPSTVQGLRDVKLGFFKAEDKVAECTSNASGECSTTVSIGGGSKVSKHDRLLVRLLTTPDGWYDNQQLVTGKSTSLELRDYTFLTPELRPGQDYDSKTAFMAVPQVLDGRVHSNGIWQVSRGNPQLQQSCEQGIDVALILDRSASVKPFVAGLKTSAKGFVEALSGTGSSVALYSFGPSASKELGLLELDQGSNLQTVKDKIDAYSPNGGTNWDRGLWQVAGDAEAYDLAIVVTDGNPTFYGDGPSGSGDFTSFKEMEQAIFSANAIKAEGTRVLAVGVGNGVSGSPANLSAVSGPAGYATGVSPAEADYFQAGWEELQQVLADIAKGATCKASLTITKREVTAAKPEGVPAAGWEFTASMDAGDGTVVPEGSQTTGAAGTVAYEVTFQTPTGSGDLAITETGRDGWSLDRVACTVNGSAAPDRLDGSAFYVQVGVGDTIDCTFFNVQEVDPTIEVTKTADKATVLEPGEDVVYTATVKNTSAETLWLDSLGDDKFGDLLDEDNSAVESSDCEDGAQIAPGGSYSCTFTAEVLGAAGYEHTNTVTAVAVDSDDNKATDSDNETVTVVDDTPVVTTLKTADPTSVDEPGGDVTYTVSVANGSSHEDVVLKSLVDTMLDGGIGFGDLLDPTNDLVENSCNDAWESDPSAVVTIAAGKAFTCTFTAYVTGPVGGTHHNVVTSVVTDDGVDIPSEDDAQVTIVDVKPSITVAKNANPTSVPETGGVVSYTVTVTNDGPVPVTLTSLVDDLFGNLAKDGIRDDITASSCVLGGTIAAGGSYDCAFNAFVAGEVDVPHVNVVTATAKDAEKNTVTATDHATVTFTDVLPTVEVTKTANPTSVPETGADVEYTVDVENTSAEPVELLSLTDDTFGDLLDDAGNGAISDSSCTAQDEIKPGKTYSCTFTARVEGLKPGQQHVNVVTGTVADDEGNKATDTGTAVVDITDVPPTVLVTKTADKASVPEPGGVVTYTVTVENTSAEKVTLTALADDKFGDLLDADNDAIQSTTCQPGQGLAADETYTCTFTAALTGLDAADTHDNTVTATVKDDDATTATGRDDESVGVTDVLPTIEVAKTAPSTIREPGGPVTYAVSVKNTSVEPVTLRTLVDDKFGDLLDDAGNAKISDSSCVDDTVIGVGEVYTCTFTGQVAGDAGFEHTNVVTATAEDDEKNTATDDDDATVTVSDVAPIIDVTKDADRTSVPETGAAVTYTVGVKNLSAEPVTLVSLVDDRFGDLLDDAANGAIRNSTCVDDTTIAVGTTYTCSFAATVGGGAGSAHVNVVTAVAVDNDGSRASDFDTATVRVTDVPPVIELTKDADTDSVPETGELVTFTVSIRNTGLETVTVTKLIDDVYGDLLDPANDSVGSSTCAKATIAAGTTYTCTFEAMVTGQPAEDHRNVITGTVRDDDGTTVTDEDDETITITDVAPTIEVTKTADVESVDAPGGAVTYTVAVENTSAEAVTLTELVDDRFGDLLDAGSSLVESTCVDGETIAAGATYTCTFTATVEGSGGFHVNVVTATVVDDDGTEAVGDDEESVVINDVLGEEEERPEGERPDGERPDGERPEASRPPRPGAGLGILPDTGVGRMAAQLGMVGALMLLVGGGILVSRRRRAS